MCLIVAAFRTVPNFDLVVAANRDEYLVRPAAPADYWDDDSGILAGRDLEAGGTWLGLNRSGRFAAVANVHDDRPRLDGAPSRGGLVSQFLGMNGKAASARHLLSIPQAELDQYNGFSMLAWDGSAFVLVTNRGVSRELAPNVYVVGNHAFGNESPRTIRARRLFEEVVRDSGVGVDEMMQVLADREAPSPSDFVGADLARDWPGGPATIFARSGRYGTRCSSVVTIEASSRATLVEWSYGTVPTVADRRSYEVELS